MIYQTGIMACIFRNDEKNSKFQKLSPSPAEKLSTTPLELAA